LGENALKIYTKTGDKGKTSLFGGDRVTKDVPRVEAYGTVDELNSVVGVARSLDPPEEIDSILREIQNDLFTLGADLATPTDSSSSIQRIQSSDVARLEGHIDRIDANLEPLKNFILPGASQLASTLHFARTVCRRAERCTVHLSGKEEVGDQPISYLNRLGDLLFVLARYANHLSGRSEETWQGTQP